jgi:hypothetical protein
MTTYGKYDTVNSEYTVSKSKYYLLPDPHLLGYINYYYEYKPHIRASVDANAH